MSFRSGGVKQKTKKAKLTVKQTVSFRSENEFELTI